MSDFYVHAISAETRDIVCVELRPVSGNVAPAEPGSHIDLHLPNGMIRQYSLINASGEDAGYRIAVKHDAKSRGGSAYIHRELRVNAPVIVGAPRNHFAVHEAAEHSVFVAGGIGITPIVSMVERLSSAGKPWSLAYAVRTRPELAYLHRIVRTGGDVRVHVDGEEGAFLDIAGVIAQAPPASHFYCCGPGPMLDAFLHATARLPQERVHFERFSGAAAPPQRGSFVVELARSNNELEVAAGESILNALRRTGHSVETSCEEGLCGTCETRVLSGTPDHRDSVLSAAERAANRSMMICCSGSLTPRLQLDL